MSLDARKAGKALWNADLRLAHLRLERWLPAVRERAVPWVSGRFSGALRLKGSGRSSAELLASADGQLALVEGEELWLCGVKIEHSHGLGGHSDADVGMHALTDAIYGALAAGDIGRHFPPSDPQWKNADSTMFLKKAVELVQAKGGRLVNLDITIVCERPKVGPHREAMQDKISEVCGLGTERVSVKATTSEKLGFTGREEGIIAQALATVEFPRT